MTNPIGGISASTPVPAAPATNALSGLGSDDFLKLLVAQLKYQDPTSPTDTSSFMTQTAQLTQVDTLGRIATQQGAMLAAALSSQAAGLVGKTVDYLDATGLKVSGTVNSATFGTDPMLRIDGVEIPLSSVTGQHTASPTA
jgi:flagellar basal-body rod modification protein FlgD